MELKSFLFHVFSDWFFANTVIVLFEIFTQNVKSLFSSTECWRHFYSSSTQFAHKRKKTDEDTLLYLIIKKQAKSFCFVVVNLERKLFRLLCTGTLGIFTKLFLGIQGKNLLKSVLTSLRHISWRFVIVKSCNYFNICHL